MDWNASDAKNRFADLIAEARKSPQIITTHGKKIVVMLDLARYESLIKLEERKSLGEIMTEARDIVREEGSFSVPKRADRKNQF